MAKYKIIFDRVACISIFSCNVVAPKFWELAKDGKVNLVGGTYNEETKKWELIIDEKDLNINKEAESVCPVLAIKIEKIG